MPEGPPADGIKRKRFPHPPAAPPGIFVTNRREKWRDMDGAHHVNNAKYLAYYEDCDIEFVRKKG